MMDGESEGSDDDNGMQDSELRLLEFAEARAKEIDAMDIASRNCVGNNTAIQSVPNHMRRRAASHNIKRLPRRLRNKATREIEDAPPKKTKRPSRKHRRRPSNLLLDYNRRKKRIMWLETHIWHAKRFHMQKIWGYKIPSFPNDKSLRACYRATNEHCLMWDLSYMNCIEIIGTQQHILEGIQKLTSPQIDLPFNCSACINGSREGSTYLFESNQYPNRAIGPITYLWKPVLPLTSNTQKGNLTRNLWIWTHPSTYKHVLAQLQLVFQANQIPSKTEVTTACDVLDIANNKQNEKCINLITKSTGSELSSYEKNEESEAKLPDVKNAIYCGPRVKLLSLKDNLCRFRLTGPQSQTVITDILKVANIISEKVNEENKSLKWWEIFFSNDKVKCPTESTNIAIDVHDSQKVALEDIKRAKYAAYLPPNTVLGLTVRDPRIFLPTKKFALQAESIDEAKSTAAMTTQDSGQSDSQYSKWPFLSYSPLWEEDIRKNVKADMVTEQEINQKRAENLLPGSEIDLGDEESRIPVMLIHRPGNIVDCEPVVHGSNDLKHAIPSCGSGYDLILPAGWGMAFWVGLVYRGARVGGVRELKNSQLEDGQFYFPDFHPDTGAGKNAEDAAKINLEDVYKKKPPAKRPNYDKLGFSEPFQCDWDKLTKNECHKDNNKDDDFYVMRHRVNLDILGDERQLNYTTDGEELKHKSVNQGVHISADIDTNLNCLVAVHLKMMLRGTCKPFSHICYPERNDCSNLKENLKHAGPVEPLHKKLLKSGLMETNVESLLSENLQKQNNASSCNIRKTIGCVCQGGFSLKLGQGAGLGYIIYSALIKLIKEQSTQCPVVLVRGPNCFQYRFAVLSVVKCKSLLCL